MDPVNVVTHGQFIETTSNGDIYRLQGAEWLVFEEFAEGFGYAVLCRQV